MVLKFKKIAALSLALVMCVTILASCGGEEEKKTSEASDKKASLSGAVKIVAAEDAGAEAVSALPGDYKISEKDTLMEVKEAVAEGDFDLAVLTPVEAARLYNQQANFKVVTTLALGNWQYAMNSYSGEELPDITFMSGARFYALPDNAMAEPKKATKKDAKKKDKTPVIAVQQPLEMSEEVLRAMMIANNRNIYANQINWQDEDKIEDVAKVKGVRLMADEAEMADLMKENKDLDKLFDFDSLWQENFKSEIPLYVLVASEDFLEDRGEEVATVVADIADKLEKSQKEADVKLVAYSDSNRGINLVKKFNDTMAKYNLNALGGVELPEDYYFYGQ